MRHLYQRDNGSERRILDSSDWLRTDKYRRHWHIYVRDDSEQRMHRGSDLRMRIRGAAARLEMSAPAPIWQTVGSGKQARRMQVDSPERAAILPRVRTLQSRVTALAAFLYER